MDTYSFLRSYSPTVGTGKVCRVSIAVEQILRMIATTHSTLSLVALFDGTLIRTGGSQKLCAAQPFSRTLRPARWFAASAPQAARWFREQVGGFTGQPRRLTSMGRCILRDSKRTQLWRGNAPGLAPDSWNAARRRFASAVHVDMVDRPCVQNLRTSKLVSAFSVQLTFSCSSALGLDFPRPCRLSF